MPWLPSNYERRPVYGPFFRLISDTQDAAAARSQALSGEVWGRVPRWGLVPTVKAFPGQLPFGAEGIEFWSFEEPDQAVGPRSYWSQRGPFVTIEDSEELAKLKIAFVRITQSLIG